jgi:gas vesicle protein
MHERDDEREGHNKGRRRMYDRDHESDYTGWSVFVVGAFIAGGVALLLGTQRGSNLRGTILRYASRATDEVAERGREAWDTAVERGKEYMETGRQAMSEAGQSAGEYGETGKEGWDTAVEHMSEAAASAPEYGETGKQAIRTSKEAGRRGKESRNEADRGGRNRYDRDYESDYTRWSAFVPGAFLGACVALLLAPQTGSQLRGTIRRYASRATDEVAERGREAWDTAVERGKEYMETGRQGMSEAGQSAPEHGETSKEAVGMGKEAVQGGKETKKEAGRGVTTNR